MDVELINNNIGTRKKLLLVLGGILIILLLTSFIKYYFAPKEIQEGIRTSRFWLSYNEFIGFSILSIIVIICIIIGSRIVRKLSINTDENKLVIEYINRFRINATIETVKLSETSIQVNEYEPRNRFYMKTGEIIYSLYLRNPNFGELKVSGQDFKNIDEIASLFQTLKDDTATKLRRTRLRRTKKKPSH